MDSFKEFMGDSNIYDRSIIYSLNSSKTMNAKINELESLFEDLKPENLFAESSEMLTLYSIGKTSGHVLDFGHSAFSVTNITDGN